MLYTYYKALFCLLRPGILTVAENRGCNSIFLPGATCCLLLNDTLSVLAWTVQAALQVKRSFFSVAFM